jgi:flavin reductase (DIM6/NTAB) family NADH-FMN oxidoreductase RutF
LVLVCIDQSSQVLAHFEVDRYFGVNILSACRQELPVRFSGKCADRFQDLKWYQGETGVPLLFDVPATFERRTQAISPAGDHVVVIGCGLHVNSAESEPLACFNRSYGRLVASR